MDKEYVTGLVRHSLTAVGGFLVARGYTDSGTVEAVIGGAAALVGLVWSMAHKKAIVAAKDQVQPGA